MDKLVPLMADAKNANDRIRRLPAGAIVSVAFLAGGCMHPPPASGGFGFRSIDATLVGSQGVHDRSTLTSWNLTR
jgi:hypothetical protein